MSASFASDQGARAAHGNNEGLPPAAGYTQSLRVEYRGRVLYPATCEDLQQLLRNVQNDYTCLAWGHETLQCRYDQMKARCDLLKGRYHSLVAAAQRQEVLIQHLFNVVQSMPSRDVGEAFVSGPCFSDRFPPPGSSPASFYNRYGDPVPHFGLWQPRQVMQHPSFQQPSSFQQGCGGSGHNNPYCPPVYQVPPHIERPVLPRYDASSSVQANAAVCPDHRGPPTSHTEETVQPSSSTPNPVDQEEAQHAAPCHQQLVPEEEEEAIDYWWHASDRHFYDTDAFSVQRWYAEACSEGLNLDIYQHCKDFDGFEIWAQQCRRKLRKADVHRDLWIQFAAQAVPEKELVELQKIWSEVDDLTWYGLYWHLNRMRCDDSRGWSHVGDEYNGGRAKSSG